MESKFFSEIEKKINLRTVKGFEKEVREKIYNELETLRIKNENLSRVLTAEEYKMWQKIRNEEYSWLVLNSKKKKRLYKLIDLYSNFIDIIDSVRGLTERVEKVKQLKELPDEESEENDAN